MSNSILIRVAQFLYRTLWTEYKIQLVVYYTVKGLEGNATSPRPENTHASTIKSITSPNNADYIITFLLRDEELQSYNITLFSNSENTYAAIKYP